MQILWNTCVSLLIVPCATHFIVSIMNQRKQARRFCIFTRGIRIIFPAIASRSQLPPRIVVPTHQKFFLISLDLFYKRNQMAKLNPYLGFNGNAQDAFQFYRSVFGGEFREIKRYKEVPGTEQMSEKERNLIMHIALPLEGESILMGCDLLQSIKEEHQTTDNFRVVVHAASKAEGERIFSALSEGGTVELPYSEGFSNDMMGILCDRYGIGWFVHYSVKF